jgi:hypothetical protein
VALKVIGAGFGRTGTLSFKTALEKLGYIKCHHMTEVLGNSQQSKYWLDMANGKEADWDTVFEGYQACVDFPACSYYYELAQYYPDAKVILTVRSPESWHKSASETIYQFNKLMPSWLRLIVPWCNHIYLSKDRKVWEGKFGGRFEDIDHATLVFNQHIAEVKRLIPSERLLVMEVSEGWQPLCDFLGVDIPNEPFPYVNDAKSFKTVTTLLKLARALPWALAAVAIILLAKLFI